MTDPDIDGYFNERGVYKDNDIRDTMRPGEERPDLSGIPGIPVAQVAQVANGDGDNSDGILKEMITKVTGEKFIKLFDTEYTNLSAIEKKLMHIVFRIILSKNFFISNELVTQYKQKSGDHSDLNLNNPTIYKTDELNDKITQLIMKNSAPYIDKIKLVRNFLTLFNKDHKLLTDTYKINVLEKDQLIYLSIQKDMLLTHLRDTGNTITNACILPAVYIKDVVQKTNQEVKAAVNNAINTVKSGCLNILDLVNSLNPLIANGPIVGGGITTTDEEEKEYRKKLIQIIQDVLTFMDKNGLGYKACNSFLEFIQQETDNIIINEKISSRLLGFIFEYCEFIYTLDLYGALEGDQGQVAFPLRLDKEAAIKAKEEKVKEEKACMENNKMKGGKKTKHRRRNKRTTIKRKRKMK